jgi:hypothetical protein
VSVSPAPREVAETSTGAVSKSLSLFAGLEVRTTSLQRRVSDEPSAMNCAAEIRGAAAPAGPAAVARRDGGPRKRRVQQARRWWAAMPRADASRNR